MSLITEPVNDHLFATHEATCNLTSFNVYINIFMIKLKDSAFIWIGDESANLCGLSICLPSRVENGAIQHSSAIYSSNGASFTSLSSYEENLARKVSKRLQCPIFLSISLPIEMGSLWDNIDPVTSKTFGIELETKLFEQIQQFFGS